MENITSQPASFNTSASFSDPGLTTATTRDTANSKRRAD
jgi:hypothetical protein